MFFRIINGTLLLVDSVKRTNHSQGFNHLVERVKSNPRTFQVCFENANQLAKSLVILFV